MTTLRGPFGLALARASASICSPATRGAAGAEVHPRVETFRRAMDIGEYQVFGRTSEDGIGALLIFSNDEQLRAFHAVDEDVAHLRCRLTTGQAVHEHAPDREQLP